MYENVAIHRYTGHLYCAKHNQHAKYVNARGSGGCARQKNFKNRHSEMNLKAFQDLGHTKLMLCFMDYLPSWDDLAGQEKVKIKVYCEIIF